MKTKNIKYKLKSGFAFFNYSRLRGVPLIFYRYSGVDYRITVDNENNIRIYERGDQSGGILILIFGSPIISNSKYLRVK